MVETLVVKFTFLTTNVSAGKLTTGSEAVNEKVEKLSKPGSSSSFTILPSAFSTK